MMNLEMETNITQFRSLDIFTIASSATDQELRYCDVLDYLLFFASGTAFSQKELSHRFQTAAAFEELSSTRLLYAIEALPRTCFEIKFFEMAGSWHPTTRDAHILENVRNLVENGRISDARHLLRFVPMGISDRVDNWRRILAKPRAKTEDSASGGGLKRDLAWLYDNSEKFRGKWVALREGELLGSHENRIELHRRLKHSSKLDGAMFFRIRGK